MDPTRTKPVLASGRLTEDWTDYVLEARLMLVHEDDDSCEPVAVPITFGEWIDEGIAGRRPTLADLEYHCTTLFPPVRPRGWLEVRWLDCLPAGLAEVASAAVTALLIDEEAGEEALEACAGVDGRASWATTASLGTQDPALAAAGGWLLTGRGAGARPHATRRRAGPSRWPTPPSGGRPRAARRPTTSRSAWPRGPRCSTWPIRPIGGVAVSATAAELAAALDASRARFLAILEPFDETVLRRQHDILMSPLLWDLAHVANYEDLWLVRALGGEPTRTGLDDLYDAFKQPRNVREALPLLDLGRRPRLRRRRARPRARAPRRGRPRRRRRRPASPATGFVHRMVAQHEHQHAETLLAAIQLLPARGGPRARRAAAARARRSTPPAEVLVPGGPFRDGQRRPGRASTTSGPCTRSTSPAFWIDAAPVTNGQYRRFVEDGGYDEPRWWSDAGWEWRQEAGLGRAAVLAARRRRAGLGCASAPSSRCPTTSRCSTSAGTRPTPTRGGPGGACPTEAEWEKAAVFDPATGDSRRWPWGDEAADRASTPTSASATSARRRSARTRPA